MVQRCSGASTQKRRGARKPEIFRLRVGIARVRRKNLSGSRKICAGHCASGAENIFLRYRRKHIDARMQLTLRPSSPVAPQ
jgi:hypothetical protein